MYNNYTFSMPRISFPWTPASSTIYLYLSFHLFYLMFFLFDTYQFPFYAGELYHQYHNDMRENYGEGCVCVRERVR
jgi:hypothetical protein